QSPSPFIAVRKTTEHLNVTTFLGGSVIGFPVCGFLPLRACFSFTENFPNPLTRTSYTELRSRKYQVIFFKSAGSCAPHTPSAWRSLEIEGETFPRSVWGYSSLFERNLGAPGQAWEIGRRCEYL